VVASGKSLFLFFLNLDNFGIMNRNDYLSIFDLANSLNNLVDNLLINFFFEFVHRFNRFICVLIHQS